MSFVVTDGPARVYGPFGSAAAAHEWVAGQLMFVNRRDWRVVPITAPSPRDYERVRTEVQLEPGLLGARGGTLQEWPR